MTTGILRIVCDIIPAPIKVGSQAILQLHIEEQ